MVSSSQVINSLPPKEAPSQAAGFSFSLSFSYSFLSSYNKHYLLNAYYVLGIKNINEWVNYLDLWNKET